MKLFRICLLVLMATVIVQCSEKPSTRGPSEDLSKSQKDFFSTAQDVSGLYGTLQSEAGDQGISIARFKAEPHRKTRYYEECPVEMDLGGDYSGFTNVILSMSKRTPILLVGETSLHGQSSALPGHSVKASLKFSAFLPVKPSSTGDSENPNAGRNAIEDMRKDRFNVARALHEMQSSLPPELWLTEAHIGDDAIEIKGATKQESAISGYIKNLKSSKELASVEVQEIRIPPARGAKTRTTTFALTCRLKEAAPGEFTLQDRHSRDPFLPSSFH